MERRKLIILTFVGYYLPGYKAGGPIRTVANMVERLGNDFQFKIVTADRDLGDTDNYSSVKIDEWNRVGNGNVFYTSPKMRSLKEYRKIFYSTDSDVIYLNSFFSPYFTIKPLLLRRLRLIPTKPVIVAPRGEFSPGALGLKNQKNGCILLWQRHSASIAALSGRRQVSMRRLIYASVTEGVYKWWLHQIFRR